MIDLRSERVRLRGWTPSDAPFVFDLYSRWDVQRYLGHHPRVMEDVSQAEALIERLRAVDDPTLGYWAVEAADSGTVVGTVMLQGIRLSGTSHASDQVEIGWHFHPDTWGSGYATDAARVALEHGFASGLDSILAVAHADNVPSQRICRRLGMEGAGITDAYYDAEYELFVAAKQRPGEPTAV